MSLMPIGAMNPFLLESQGAFGGDPEARGLWYSLLWWTASLPQIAFLSSIL